MSQPRSTHRNRTAPAHAPVVFVHASGESSPDPAWLRNLLESGATLYCHRPFGSCQKTSHNYDRLGPLLKELSHAHPGQAIVLLRAGIGVTGQQLARLCEFRENVLQAATALSNADPELNPLAGLTATERPEPCQIGVAIDLMGTGLRPQHTGWPAHLVCLSPQAAMALSEDDINPANAASRLHGNDGSIVVDERIYVHDPRRSVFNATKLAPHESARPPAWGLLSSRLQAWLDAGCPDLDAAGSHDDVTLHVSHSWGGGVAQWISQFIDADKKGAHYQLLAEGPQSGHGPGQRLSLYSRSELSVPLAQFWLQPPITSISDQDPHYREILDRVCRRYGVGRIIVSSLVGHSLDVFRSGLPTIQVLHDQFPIWPFLSQDPAPYLGESGADLAAATDRLGPGSEFSGLSAAMLESIGDRYFEAVHDNAVRLAAPTRSVTELRRALDPRWRDSDIEIIPHGIPAVDAGDPVAARPRKDGRLNVVIPGRIQPGKGQRLLLDSLERLTPIAHFTLLGTGKSGEAFFGHEGVNVITEYRRSDLPDMLREIGPDLALLLSIVPETFSYTLSEMWALGVPVMATRLGSFAERITDGETGWLFDPEPEALEERLATLAEDRQQIATARSALGNVEQASPEQMLDAYNALCPAGPPLVDQDHGSGDLWQVQASSLAWLETSARSALGATRQSLDSARKEISTRTHWALDTQKALEEEQQRRIKWVASLEQEQDRLKAIIKTQASQLETLDDQNRQARKEIDQLQESFDQVLGSSSWRITRPFRVARRTARNFMHSRAWNPLRWPLLLSGLVRNLATTGLRGTLMRMQYQGYEAPAPEQVIRFAEEIGDPTPPMRIPCADRPMVSIVIPIFNQWVYTAACLRSLAEARCYTRFEVIVVDDASTDDSFEHLRHVEGLRTIRNEQNSGFIDSCNRGAEQARGEYIVLLNNDTRVTDGWLDALVNTFREFPDAGLVGSRLVYPDGRLQECGGIVFNDGSGWNFGRGDEADHPQYGFVRDVDYCSGASIMVDAGLFRELGGFDTHYRPAYYEDTDLAFRVRAAGRRVLVQPRSTVVHYEGITSGTDTGSGVKQHQVTNREKFLERWQGALQDQPARIEDPSNPALIRQARDHGLRGRVLIIDATTPEPDQDSGSLRLTNIMRCFLDLGWGVSFFAENHAHAGRYTRELQMLGVETWYEPWLESNHDFLRGHGAEFSLVMVSRHYVASNFISMIRKHCPNAVFVFDTVDLHYLREMRLAELEDSATLKAVARQTRRSELAVIEASDAVLVVSPTEVEVLAEDAPSALVHVLSNVHDVPGQRRGFEDRSDLFFVGGYQHPPNVDAMQWFVGEIWPLIHAEMPDVCFHLIGSKAPEAIRELKGDGVFFHGFIEDLDQYLDGCRLAVAPLRYGAGVKGKVNMSMAHGQPVVATPIAIEGIHAQHEHDVLVAESEQEFAEQVVRLYRDRGLWERLSENGIDNVRRHFSLDAARDSIEALLERLGPVS